MICLTRPFSGVISIHAPFAGGDQMSSGLSWLIDISIHAPFAGGDNMVMHLTILFIVFQSTPPSQGATARIGCPPTQSPSF